MSSLGQTLRQAREAKGLSQSKVAAETRILVQIINDIENEDFHSIAAPIYGRGFVRLFAECVGLDPQPLIREFMDIYAGRRAPTVHVREIPAETAPPAPQPIPPPPPEPEPSSEEPEPVIPFSTPEAPEPLAESIIDPIPEPTPSPIQDPLPPVVEPPQSVRGLDLFDQVARPTPPPPESPATTIRTTAAESPFLPSTFEEGRPSAADRFRTGLSSVSHGVVTTVRQISPTIWRKAILVIGALAIVALIIFGCSKLYQMTTPSTKDPSCANGACEFNPTDVKTATKAPVNVKTPPKAPGKLKSTGQKIPTLYVD